MYSYKSYAKVNVFLKIVWVRENYHELSSRFVLVRNLYDVIGFEQTSPVYSATSPYQRRLESSSVTGWNLIIEGECGCEMEKNTIYKWYVALLEFVDEKRRDQIKKFFEKHKITVQKNIPIGSGLGWWSSNVAMFLTAINNILNLNLSQKDLFTIWQKVWADVSFFLSWYESANVSGIWEIVEEFKENLPEFEIFVPKVFCETKKVFQEFRANFLDLENIDMQLVKKLEGMKTEDILTKYNIFQLNDLLKPSLKIYPELEKSIKSWYFFSGSGSAFFTTH